MAFKTRLRGSWQSPFGALSGTLVASFLFAAPGCTPASLRNLQRGCDQGSAAACARLGTAYYEGRDDKGQSVDLDLEKARRAFEGACSRDDAASCASLGDMLGKGEGGPADKARGVSLHRRACELGAGPACAKAAVAYRDGTAVPKSPELAATSARKGCDKGDSASCALFKELATVEGSGGAGMTAEAKQAMDQCEAGNGSACFDLGLRYDDGKGLKVDKTKAAAMYKISCEKGDSRACHNFGVMLIDGEGVPRSIVAGLKVLDLLCQKGQSKSCDVLVSKLNKACLADEPSSCTLVGRFLLQGEKGLEVNLVKGVEYLRRACRLGSNDGCEDLRKLGLE